jgi:hypothetical protein
MILRTIAEKLKRRSKDDFKGRHFEAAQILQAVCWYLRYPLSYCDIEELFLKRRQSLRPESCDRNRDAGALPELSKPLQAAIPVSQLVPIGSPTLQALVAIGGKRASMRFLEFFAVNIRNPHTRRAYFDN